MAIKEYEPGTAFPGVIGRTIGESSPAWPRPLRAKPGAPNVLFIVLDDTGFGQLGCYGSPIRTPNLDRLAGERPALQQHAHHRALLAEPLVHPDRPQPPLERDGLHHRGRDRLPRLQRPHPVRERLPLRDAAAARLQHVRASASGTSRPPSRRSAAGPYDRWPLGRGFERFYGFLGGDTHQYYPDLVYDNHQVEPPTTPEEGYHLTEDLVDQRHRVHRRRQAGRARQAVLPVLLPRAPCTRRTRCRRSGPTSTRASSTTAGTPTARRCSQRQLELGIVPPGTRAVARTIPTSRTGTRCRADEKRLYARMMEVFAGFLEHTDHHIGRLLDFLEKTRASSTTRSSW